MIYATTISFPLPERINLLLRLGLLMLDHPSNTKDRSNFGNYNRAKAVQLRLAQLPLQRSLTTASKPAYDELMESSAREKTERGPCRSASTIQVRPSCYFSHQATFYRPKGTHRGKTH